MPTPKFLQRLMAPLDERLGVSGRLKASLSARTVPAKGRRFWYCFGGLSLVASVMQALSGGFLSFYYQPTTDRAYASVFYISNYVHYGWLIRSVHVWGARMMIALVLIHMARVYITASYKHPREFNWVAGALLFAVTLSFMVSGSLLPWNQEGYWATRSLANLLSEIPYVGGLITRMIFGGTSIGNLTLTRFYAFHIMLLPAGLTALLAAHFWMVRKQGIARPL